MTLSHDELRRVVQSIEEELDESQVRRVRERDPLSISIEFYVGERFRRLLISARVDEARLHYTEQRSANTARAGHPTAFVMTLRKYLTDARMTGMRLNQRDRVLVIDFVRIVDGETSECKLVFECTGYHPNLFLTDQKLTILARLSDGYSKKRDLSVGKRYAFPLEPEKEGSLHQTGLVRFMRRGDLLSQDIERHYLEVEAARVFKSRVRSVKKRIKASFKHEDRKRRNVQEDRDTASESGRYQSWADALKANLYRFKDGRVPRGADFLELELEGETLRVPLDPRLGLRGNMEAYYRRAHKYSTMGDFITARLEKLTAAVDKIRADVALLEETRRSRDEETLIALEMRYPDRDDDRSAPAAPARKTREEREPYMRFRASDGSDILVGRSARDNETLTFRVANGSDRWFHARDFQGSHVILRGQRGKEPRTAALDDAALLAAWFSKGREEQAVDVTTTDVKHIRPVKDAAPGRVHVANGRTIRVRLDPKELKRFFPDREFLDRGPRPKGPPRRRRVS